MSAQPPAPTERGILQFLAICDSFYPPDAVQASIEQQRHWYDALCARFDRPLPPEMIFADGMLQRIPIRRYRPRKISTRTILLYLHGGGFVVGSLESHHAICAEIADFAGAELVSVDYRLAPEYRWPAQTDDGFTVLKHLLSANSKVVLIGDSAGANLAAGLALRARDEGLSGVVGQVLIYPALGGDLAAGSYVEMAAAPGLTTADVAYYREILQAPAGNEIAEPAAGSFACRAAAGLHHGRAFRSASGRRPALCRPAHRGGRRSLVPGGAADGARVAARPPHERRRARRLPCRLRGH